MLIKAGVRSQVSGVRIRQKAKCLPRICTEGRGYQRQAAGGRGQDKAKGKRKKARVRAEIQNEKLEMQKGAIGIKE